MADIRGHHRFFPEFLRCFYFFFQAVSKRRLLRKRRLISAVFFAHTGQQPPLQRGDLLTLTAAIETALANNPTNQRAVQSVYAAKYSYDQALSAYLPEINAGYSLGHTLSRGWDL